LGVDSKSEANARRVNRICERVWALERATTVEAAAAVPTFIAGGPDRCSEAGAAAHGFACASRVTRD
jgi:hypothetical protein